MAFFQRVFSYVFNEVLVNTLANRYRPLDYKVFIPEAETSRLSAFGISAKLHVPTNQALANELFNNSLCRDFQLRCRS